MNAVAREKIEHEIGKMHLGALPCQQLHSHTPGNGNAGTARGVVHKNTHKYTHTDPTLPARDGQAAADPKESSPSCSSQPPSSPHLSLRTQHREQSQAKSTKKTVLRGKS